MRDKDITILNKFVIKRFEGDVFEMSLQESPASFTKGEFINIINSMISLEQGVEDSGHRIDFHHMALEQYKNVRKLREAFENAKRLKDPGFSQDYESSIDRVDGLGRFQHMDEDE